MDSLLPSASQEDQTPYLGQEPDIASVSSRYARTQTLPPSSRTGCDCGGVGCSKCRSTENIVERMAAAPSYVYAIGRIEPRYPNLSVEKEFAHAVGRAETVGLSDTQALREVLAHQQNRYLAREICWVFTIQGIDMYHLLPRDISYVEELIETLRPAPRPTDIDVIVGTTGPLSSLCNGQMLETVAFDLLFSFDVDSFIEAIPRAENIAAEQFDSAAEQILVKAMQRANNKGDKDEDRALNLVITRYPAIYAATAEALGRNESFTKFDVYPSQFSGGRRYVDVVMSFINRQTDVINKLFVRVDVTGKFPFLVTKLSPYYDR